jgi:hypothetical protein
LLKIGLLALQKQKLGGKKKNQTPQPNTFEPLIVFWAWQQEPQDSRDSTSLCRGDDDDEHRFLDAFAVTMTRVCSSLAHLTRTHTSRPAAVLQTLTATLELWHSLLHLGCADLQSELRLVSRRR